MTGWVNAAVYGCQNRHLCRSDGLGGANGLSPVTMSRGPGSRRTTPGLTLQGRRGFGLGSVHQGSLLLKLRLFFR